MPKKFAFIKAGNFSCINNFLIEILTKEFPEIYLLGSPEKCQAFGEKGYQIATERYSWKKVGIKLRENIERLILK